MSFKQILDLFKQTGKEWSEDKVPRLGAALAYYTVFSIGPLLIIAIAIAGLVFGQEAARNQITAQLGTLMSPDAAKAINEMIENAGKKESTGIIATAIGFVTLLFGASGVFGQLKDAMNTIWGVQPKPGAGIMATVKERFFSFTMVLGVGFLLLVTLLLSTGITAAQNFVFGKDAIVVIQIINQIVSLLLITGLFALIFKIIPDVEIAWKDVWIGALLTSFLFAIGKYIIGKYLATSATASTYGAAGSLVIILLWIYYSTQILFFGAEFTQVYANKYGSKLVPAENAVPLTEEARAKQGIPTKQQLKEATAAAKTSITADGSIQRTPKPIWKSDIKAQAESQKATPDKLKKVEKQRYVAALGGFLLALFLGAFKSLRGDKSDVDHPSI
ncbi:MAG: YihY/virulence factor BrkB family protein [Herpetosiphon sp.]|nr:YihY/virulence factor BrkB family protein [Herpetosiphon sp.]